MGGAIDDVKVPLTSVVPWLGLSVPSVDVNVTAWPDAGFPLLSEAATIICHGPFPGPPFAGVAMITRDPLDLVEDVTVIVAIPDLVASCVDVAVMSAVPVDVGVKTPALLTLPIFDGLTDHVTELLKFPVPVTVGVQVEV